MAVSAAPDDEKYFHGKSCLILSGEMATTLKRKIIRSGGLGLVKRLIKPIPIIGPLFAAGLAAHEIRKKGLLPGAIHVGLDATPVVGIAKKVVEMFTGDLIPNKPGNDAAQRSHRRDEARPARNPAIRQ